MWKHNAVAKWLKVSIKEHVFDPVLFASVIPADGSFQITGFSISSETNTGTYTIQRNPWSPPSVFTAYMALVFDQFGYIFDSYFGTQEIHTREFIAEIPPDRAYWCIGFRADYKNKKPVVHGFD